MERGKSSDVGSARAQFVKVLVLSVFALCMTAPEDLLAPIDLDALNPFAGSVKLAVLVLGGALVILCGSGKDLKSIASPFRWLIGWALICWFVSGSELLPLRNLVSSFGGIVVLAGLCGAAEFVGGARGVVRLMVWALVITAALSVLLGFLGIEPMLGELSSTGNLELFHGVGGPGYVDAACACLIAWMLARHLENPSARSMVSILLLLIIPVLTLLRAYSIGIVVSVMVAALLARWRRTRNPAARSGAAFKSLALLALFSLAAGATIFLAKTGSREEGSEFSGRDIIWPIEIASVLKHPVFGLGPFGDIQLLFFDEGLPQVGAAHSDYLGAAVCYGLPGLFFFVGAMAGVGKRVRRRATSSAEQRECRDAALLSLAALATTMIAENVIRDPRLFAMYLLFPAVCLSAGMFRRPELAR